MCRVRLFRLGFCRMEVFGVGGRWLEGFLVVVAVVVVFLVGLVMVVCSSLLSLLFWKVVILGEW